MPQDKNHNHNAPADQKADAGQAASLPQEYAVDAVDVIPCSPRLIFVAWELGGEGGRQLRERVGSQVDWVIRIINVEADTENDVPIDPSARRHYLHVEPGHHYRVELGVFGPGGYHTVCKGGEVQMPPAQPAEEEPVEWVNFRSAHPAPRSESEPDEPGRRPPAGEDRSTGLKWEPGLIGGASSSDIRPPTPEETEENEG